MKSPLFVGGIVVLVQMPGVYFPISLARWLFLLYPSEKGADLDEVCETNEPTPNTKASDERGNESFSTRSSPPGLSLTLASVSFLQGNVTFSCSPPQLVSCTFLSSSSSFLSLPSAAAAGTRGFSIGFQFRTWNADGVLLSLQLNPEPQRLELRISNSRLSLTLQNSGRQKSEVSVGESASGF